MRFNIFFGLCEKLGPKKDSTINNRSKGEIQQNNYAQMSLKNFVKSGYLRTSDQLSNIVFRQGRQEERLKEKKFHNLYFNYQ